MEGDEKHIIVALGSPLLTGARKEKEKNVILISLDTLRADRLGCYGCDRETSPNIDRFAREGTLFLNAASNSNWTLPSHMSMFTGVYPYESGFIKGDDIHSQSYMSDSLVPLAQYLKNRDYLTFGVQGGGFVSEGYGFDRGFDLYYKAGKDAAKGVGDTIMMLEKYSERKFFLFYHTFEIHDPYTRSYFVDRLPPNALRLDRIIAAYDSGIRYTDVQLGRLFEWLRKKDLYDNTLIIITSDHGENFDVLNERKNSGSHGRTLYDPETHIPFIIGGASEFASGSIVSSQVSSVDILPTILSYLGIDQRNEVRGRSLYPGEKLFELKERPAYSEAVHTQIESKSLRSPKRKLIANIPGRKAKIPEGFTPYEFYDLKIDPKEKSNIWDKKTKTALKYRSLLHRIMNSVERNRFKIMKNIKKGFTQNEELEQDLRNLGYLGN